MYTRDRLRKYTPFFFNNLNRMNETAKIKNKMMWYNDDE